MNRSLAETSEVGLDGIKPCDAVHKCGGADEIGLLDEFEPRLAEFEACAVERATGVGDEDDFAKLVNFDEELEFVHDALFFEMGLCMTGEAGGAAGEGDAVVAGEIEAVLEEIIKVFTDTAVGAVDGRGVDAGGFIRDATGVTHAGSTDRNGWDLDGLSDGR